MKRANGLVMAGVMLGAAGRAGAHLKTGSLTLGGRSTFTVGDTVTVKWTIESTHPDGSFDINFSKDGGKTFTLIEKKVFPLSTGPASYKWTIPNEPTTTGRFQLCQFDGKEIKCTFPYTLQSEDLTISGTSSIQSIDAVVRPTIQYDRNTRSLQVTFALNSEKRVLVQAYNAQGKGSTLLDGLKTIGEHSLSFTTIGLDASGPLVFKVSLGGQVYSKKWDLIE